VAISLRGKDRGKEKERREKERKAREGRKHPRNKLLVTALAAAAAAQCTLG